MFKKLLAKKEEGLTAVQAGFTLIEIVLVLAIAGLIMVIVFAAVQGANRGRRDTERRSAVGRLLAAAEQDAANEGGAVPTNCADIGTAYNAAGYGCVDGAVADTDLTQTIGNVRYYADTDCADYTANNPRIVAARVLLETGNQVLCQATN